MSKMKTCWVTGWLLSRLECRISAREHSTRSGILLHFSQTQGALYVVRNPPTLFANSGSTLRGQESSYTLRKLREHSTRVRNPSTLFAATMKTQRAVRDPPTLFGATMKTKGALYVVRDPTSHSS